MLQRQKKGFLATTLLAVATPAQAMIVDPLALAPLQRIGDVTGDGRDDANADGIAQHQVTMPVSPTLLGASISLQSVVVDPLANALGLVTSNAIDLTTNN